MTASSLRLGVDVVSRLLPHRRPLLLVDTVEHFERAPRLLLRASKYIGAGEPVFEGHFPGMHLWPGIYTIEGCGQTIHLLQILQAIVSVFESRGQTEADALDTLRSLDERFHLRPEKHAERADALLRELGDERSRLGVSAAVDVRLLEPVFAGCRLDYEVVFVRALDRVKRFDVVASVAGRPVLRGAMTSADLSGRP